MQLSSFSWFSMYSIRQGDQMCFMGWVDFSRKNCLPHVCLRTVQAEFTEITEFLKALSQSLCALGG
jgi:hypothetical protein